MALVSLAVTLQNLLGAIGSTTPHHPSAERAVKTFKLGIKKWTNGTLQTQMLLLLFYIL